MRRILGVGLLVLMSACGAGQSVRRDPAVPDDERLEETPRVLDGAALDAFVREALTTLAVPGAAVAVVVDGRVVYERAFGVRTLGESAAVTLDTRFLIASVTKTMTTMMQAAIVDAGVLRWDSPISSILPQWKIGDAALMRALRLWHMSCACSGMPNQDMEGLYEWEGVTPEQRIATWNGMKPTAKLGETYQYSNPMVAIGGFAAAHAFAPDRPLGEAYAAAMQKKIFDPIGMTGATLDFATIERGEHARPHALTLDGETRVLPLAIERGVEPIAPAGGIWATLRDMEKYVATELALGVAPSGTRVVTAANVQERHKLRVRIDETDGYGLGLGVSAVGGRRVLRHSGGSMGFGSTLYLLPDQRVGIVILTNVRNGNGTEQLPFNAAVRRRVIELLFAAARPRATAELAEYKQQRIRTPHVQSTDRAWERELAGTYHHATLGTIVIRQTATGAELDAGEWRTAIDRVVEADGTAKLVVLDPPFAGGSLLVVPGSPPALRVPGQVSYTFTSVR